MYPRDAPPADLVQLCPLPLPHPGQCCSVRGRNDPAGLQRCFLGGRGKKEVFVMSSSLKSFMLKLDILTSIFRNIFAQDCRIELAGLTFFLTQIWQHFLEFDLYLFVLSFEFLKCSVVLQDYHGWWRSFVTGGSGALYFFLYSIYFFCTKLTITGTASTFLYFGYTLIMVLIFFLFTGKNTNDIHHLLTLFKSESP